MHVSLLQYENLTKTELDALLAMFINSYAESDYMASREVADEEMLRKILVDKDRIHFIAYDEQEPIGYCQVVYRSESINFHSGAKINAIAVLPTRRGQGVGTQLLTAAIETLRQNPKIKNIYLDVAKDNIGAIELYKKLGFEKVGELKSLFTKNEKLIDIETYSLLIN